MKNKDVGEYVSALLASDLGRQVTHHRLLPAREAAFAPSRRPWPKAVQNLLDAAGISLYSHQALATDHIRAGHGVVVATPTASGKSLIYNLPVLERHLADPDARALYLFPLKALAQDQLASFASLTATWPEAARPSIALYDGDTSDHFRRKIRQNPPHVLVTNPEMLHLAILPHHEQWAAFLAGLSFVVVDEAHTYRGVFGAHMAQVLRRLNRIAGRYGARPTHVFCTATVGNPGELAQRLMGADALPTAQAQAPVVISESGAPQGARHFVFLNPELSASTAAISLLKAALARDLRTIVYCRSRRMTELVSLWAGSNSGRYRDRISAYRAGFLPEERRNIEAKMASGELLAVVSTSALELGIDIGGLDVCILVGYPGTIMSTLQRGGRVGRAQQESAVILVTGEDALDQYFARNPHDFFARPPEKAVLNPENPVILARHLECAAAEQPLRASEAWLGSRACREAISELCNKGLLLESAEGGQWLASRKRPQRHVDLRGCGQSFTIEDTQGNVIGMVDGFRAWREAHPGAVYLHRGISHVVEELDPGQARIVVRPATVNYFTRTRGQKSTDILEERGRLACGRFLVCHGRLRITDQITGYEKRATSGNRLLTIVPLDVPPQVFETEGLWYVIPEAIRTGLEERFVHFMGSIHAMEHAVIGMLPLQVMADRNDFGGISTPLHPQTGLATIFVYDGLPGGAGLTREAFDNARTLLEDTRRAIATCPCEDGCPSCVHSPKCGSGNRPISKQGALDLLAQMLETGDEGGELARSLTISPAPDRLEQPGPPTQPPARKPVSVADSAAPGQSAPTASMPDAGAAGTSKPQAAPGHFVVFDVETRRSAAEVGGWHNTAHMGVSVAVLYDSREDHFFSYEQDQLPAMLERMRASRLVIGFNSLRFDYGVLAPFADFDLHTLPTLDLLVRIKERLGYRIPLDNLGLATLGEPKSADGLQALQWWQEGKTDLIAAYCRKDVELTLRLYRHGLEQGHVLFTNKAGQRVRLPVDFGQGPF